MTKTILVVGFYLLLAVFSSMTLAAQSALPLREVGIQFNRLDFDGGNSFSAIFKKKKREDTYRRIRFFTGSLLARATEDQFEWNIDAGIGLGREKRRALHSKLEFYQGPEFSAGLRVTSFLEVGAQMIFTPGVNWVLGLQQHFNDQWALNVEVLPGMSMLFYGNTNDTESRTFQFNARLNHAVSIALVPKF